MWQKCDRSCYLVTAASHCFKFQSVVVNVVPHVPHEWEIFQNHVTLTVKAKLECQWRQIYQNFCSTINSDSKYKCIKRFYNYWKKKQPTRHFLKPIKPAYWFLYVSLIVNTHRTLKIMIDFWSIFRTSCLLSRCPNGMQWTKWISPVIIVVSVQTCFGRKNT